MLTHGRGFSQGTPGSSTTKTGCHDIAEILLKVALNTKNQIKSNHQITVSKIHQFFNVGWRIWFLKIFKCISNPCKQFVWCFWTVYNIVQLTSWYEIKTSFYWIMWIVIKLTKVKQNHSYFKYQHKKYFLTTNTVFLTYQKTQYAHLLIF